MTLLRQTDRPVTDIAWDVGFASLGTFSRTFATIVGCTDIGIRDPFGNHVRISQPGAQ